MTKTFYFIDFETSQKTCNADTEQKKSLLLVYSPGSPHLWSMSCPNLIWYSSTSAVSSTKFSKEQVCLAELILIDRRTGRELCLWRQCRKKLINPKTTHLEWPWDYKAPRKLKKRPLLPFGRCSQSVCSFFLCNENGHKVYTWIQMLWSIWIWDFSLNLFLICFWANSGRLECGLAPTASNPCSSCFSNLQRLMPAIPIKTPHMQGMYQSAIPLEHLTRASLQKCVNRQDAQLSHYPGKAPFWTLTQISHDPTQKNITASAPTLPFTKQGRWIALLIFPWHPSLRWSSNFSPFLNSVHRVSILAAPWSLYRLSFILFYFLLKLSPISVPL